MPYITREDGEHFVIPSYRDVLAGKQKNQLKKDILQLSQSYGEYITLQKKGTSQYEVAFSPDLGYLLGESIWHHFNKPLDLIYCEAIPNTTEAILVIVKSGSVYLDGSFQLDSIPEELIIFLTQQNNFEIYTYGDVPISQEPEAGKFSFEASSVKSFTQLDKPVFPTLPLLKMYQLQPVDTVLREQGISGFPLRNLAILVGAVVLGYIAYTLIPTRQVTVEVPTQQINPYQAYYNLLTSSAPDVEIANLANKINTLLTIPGWSLKELKYLRESITAKVASNGATIDELYSWAKANRSLLMIRKNGIFLSLAAPAPNRPKPTNIYPTPKVIAMLVDRIAKISPGNNITIGDFVKKGVYTTVQVKINLYVMTPVILDLIGKQLNGLPLVLQNISLTFDANGNMNGSIIVDAIGN